MRENYMAVAQKKGQDAKTPTLATAQSATKGYIAVDSKGSASEMEYDPENPAMAASDSAASGQVSDQKSVLPGPLIHPSMKKILSTMMKVGKGGKAKPRLNNLRTKMVVSGAAASSSGSPYTSVINVRPAALSEFTSFANLFDEFKVHGGVLHFSVWATGQADLVVANEGAIGYDPVDNAVYASVAGVLVASQKFGPFQMAGVTDASLTITASRTCAPVPHTKTGFWSFKFKCPKGSQQVPNNSQQVQTGNWCDTNIGSTLGDYGYLKPYISGAGSTVTSLEWYLEMDVEFRSRT